MVANISTMLGLLGTVYGLIYALEGLDDASNIERTARPCWYRCSNAHDRMGTDCRIANDVRTQRPSTEK